MMGSRTKYYCDNCEKDLDDIESFKAGRIVTYIPYRNFGELPKGFHPAYKDSKESKMCEFCSARCTLEFLNKIGLKEYA
jgi:hypothetical protein